MAGYGLGFGSITRSRQYAALGQNVPASALRPSAAWDGTPGSGFAGFPPVDPPRATAKPVCRLLTPPNQYFTDELVIGVWAGANHNGSLLDNLGVERVIAHCEGTSFEITAPSFLLFEDANGQPRRYLGWWVVLQHPGTDGDMQAYFEAVPKDATMQHRVIGPYQFSAATTLHDVEIEVNSTLEQVTGERYQSLSAAYDFLRNQAAQNPLVTITGGGPYNLVRPSFTYSGIKGWVTTTASAPVIFRNEGTWDEGVDGSTFRPRISAKCFRGSNITFDFINTGGFTTETDGRLWLDGVNVTNSHPDGAYRLYGGRPPQISQLWRENPWLTECNVSNVLRSGVGASLVRGGTFTDCADDLFTDARCVLGTVTSGLFSDLFREEIAAISLQYSGSASTATIAITGNVTATRTVTLKENGSTVATLSIPSPATITPMQDVVDFIDGQAGWNATLLDGTRAANYIGSAGNVETGTPETDAKSAAVTLVSSIPLHTDWYQLSFSSTGDENIILAHNRMYDSSAQSVFISGQSTTPSDFMVLNNAFDNVSTDIGFSQWGRAPFSHVVMAHNSWSNQGVILRVDQGLSTDAYCLIANNVVPELTWTGAADPDLVIANNHLFAAASVPSGATGTIVGGTKNSLLRDPSAGDFTPQGELLSHPKPPVARFDLAGIARSIPAPVGALAGGGEVAPAITSSNPSGTYAEGAPVGGTLTANKPVSWSVTGPDAAHVQLAADFGDWALEPTDFETQESYAFTFVATDLAGDSVEQAIAIAISDLDEIAPTLAVAIAAADGTSAANLTVSTDEASGTLYWFVSPDSTPPDAAALMAGAGAVASGSRAVLSAGPQAISVSGLAAGTAYFAHFLHRDGASNASAVLSSAAFTTEPATTGNPAVTSFAPVLNTSDFGSVYTAAPFAVTGTPGNALLVIVAASQQSTQALTDLSATLDGVPLVRLAGGAHSAGASRPIIGVFMASGLAAGNRTIAAQIAGNARSCTILAVEVSGIDLATPLANLAVREGTALGYSHSYTPDRAGNLVLSVLGTRQGDRGPFTPDPGMVTLLDASSGPTSSNDHTAFAGYLVAASTAATDVGATPALEAEALFVVAELNAV